MDNTSTEKVQRKQWGISIDEFAQNNAYTTE